MKYAALGERFMTHLVNAHNTKTPYLTHIELLGECIQLYRVAQKFDEFVNSLAIHQFSPLTFSSIPPMKPRIDS